MKVSFLTTTHNHEKYIERCIQSVLYQDHVDVEHVVVDDGSTDRTGEIVQRYAAIHPRIKYFRQDNIGVRRLAETYNLGLSKCTGDIVAVLEGDDWAHPSRASYHLDAFKNPGVILSWGITERFNDAGNYLGMEPQRPWEFVDLPRNAMTRKMLQGCHMSANTVAVQRRVMNRLGGFIQGDYYVDYPTWLALIPHGQFHFTNAVLSYWGVHGDSYSSTLGPTARPDLDALAAYRAWPPLWQAIMSVEELTIHWNYVRSIGRKKNWKDKLKEVFSS